MTKRKRKIAKEGEGVLKEAWTCGEALAFLLRPKKGQKREVARQTKERDRNRGSETAVREKGRRAKQQLRKKSMIRKVTKRGQRARYKPEKKNMPLGG